MDSDRYLLRLQWYYLLGTKHVILCHGWGDVEPFDVQECELVQVARDEAVINMLLHGIKLLDEALASGWRPEPIEKEIISNTPEIENKITETRFSFHHCDSPEMVAFFDNFTVGQYQNFVGVLYGGKAVCNNEHRADIHHLFQGILN